MVFPKYGSWNLLLTELISVSLTEDLGSQNGKLGWQNAHFFWGGDTALSKPFIIDIACIH